MYRVHITVTLRKSILDPQGKAVHHALESLALQSIREVRIGKQIELLIDAADEQTAKRTVETACEKLLANPVMEEYHYAIEQY